MSLSEQELEEQSEVELEETTLSDTPNSAENIENMTILDQFPSDMVMDPTEMEIDDSLIVESNDVIEHEEEVIQTDDDIDPQEVEIQSDEQSQVVEEVIEKKYKPPPSVPPLRLLNIAPKPEQVPIVKSVSGQPVLLVPGSSGGQTIKLVNQQGQEINLGNYSLGRPITIKQPIKTSVANSSIVTQQAPPKQIFMKKIITTTGGQKTVTKPIAYAKPGQQFVVVHKSSDQPQQIKLVSSSNSNSSTTTKTITFQQAQEMGLLGNAKIIHNSVQQVPSKRTVLVNKAQPKTIKLVSQGGTTQVVNSVGNIKTISLGQVKAPTKILPAAVSGIGGVKGPQRIILKSSNGNQVLPAGQLIQVAGTQGLANGQIHQINVPGKGVQYIKFVTSTSAEQSSNSTVTVVNSLRTSNTASTSVSVATDVKPIMTTTKVVTKPKNASGKPTQVMLVPAGYMPATVQQVPKIALPPVKHTIQPKQSLNIPKQPQPPSPPETSSSPEPSESSPETHEASLSVDNQSNSANGIRPRKPCNCTKSQCLKLYCDCFANGEFCYLCNCVNCFNNLENEETRTMAIRACLERNPNAFRPKIGKAKDTTGDVLRKHTKGCNCKRSGCLKNYCECYEAKIACSNNCKCVGCRNVEDSLEKKKFSMSSTTQRMSADELTETVYRKILPYYKEMNTYSPIRHRKSNLLRKQPVTFITEEVIEATCQCLLTISDEADSNMQDEELTKRQIIEEFGGCLKEIINCSLTRSVS